MATTAALTENSRQGINLEIPPFTGPQARLNPYLLPGCGHAYDETPVGLAVYVRNDPINFIDPDGRQARALDYHDSPIIGVSEGMFYFTGLWGTICQWVEFGFGSGGGISLPNYGPDSADRKAALDTALNGLVDRVTRIREGVSALSCGQFLLGLISNLGGELKEGVLGLHAA